jgi:uncharacterized phage protein gp47/JayE
MTSVIDETGMTLDSFAEAKSNAIAKLKAAFGDNLKTDDQSLAGILGTLLGEMIADQNDLIRQVANARNPQAAQGVHLTSIAQFNGLARRAPEYSTVSFTCVANAAGSTIPAGSLVQDPNDSTIEFATDTTLVLAASETNTVSATATTAGAIFAEDATLTKIVNPVFGWASVTNGAAAVPGRSLETDTDFRARRKQISRRVGNQSLPKIYQALSNIAEIGRVVVRENNTGYTDSLGQVGHSVWAVAQGGTDQEIAAALFANTSAGINYHGTTSVVYPDPVTGRDYTVKFSRVIEIPVEMSMTLDKSASYPAEGDTLIKAALVAYFAGEFVKTDGETDNGFSIAERVGYFRCLTPINSIGGHSVVSFTIGYKGGTLYSGLDIPIGQTELATLDPDDIEIVIY